MISLLLEQRYQERIPLTKHPLTKQLFALMEDKQTNLAFSADLTHQQALLQLAETLGPYICLLKTHIDIIEDYDADLIPSLENLAKKHRFLILEDRKFADIGHTVQQQYQGGIYRIADWAHLVTAHSIAGPGTIEGLKSIGASKQRGALLITTMSSSGALDQSSLSIQLAKQHKDLVIGLIAQQRLIPDPDLLIITPGINLNVSQDHLGQRYLDPKTAILQHGSDILIVGRQIYQAPDPKLAAQELQRLSWHLYQERLQRTKK